MTDYLVQQEDGVSRFMLQEGDGFILLQESGIVPPPTDGTFVPVRYILSGETANVVPVQTVLVGGIDVVPVREFVGPANVVPVREVTTEVPRVKVVKV
jgi:hypothetical protein